MPNPPNKLLIHAGTRFGKLVVLRELPSKTGGKRVFLLKCDCGNEASIKLETLRHHGRKSCGCLKDLSHGLRHHPLYKVWCGIKARCGNAKSDNWSRYGGRGIRLCAEW